MNRSTSQAFIRMVTPALALTLLGILAAAAHLQLATFAIGAWTFPLAIVVPMVICGRMLLASHSVSKSVALASLAVGMNLVVEAVGTTAQLAILG